MSEAYTLAVYSAEHWDAVGEDGYLNAPIGTGPFRFAELKVMNIFSTRGSKSTEKATGGKFPNTTSSSS